MPNPLDAINGLGAPAPQRGIVQGGSSAPVNNGPVSFGGGDRVTFSSDVGAPRGNSSVPNLGWARQPKYAAGGT